MTTGRRSCRQGLRIDIADAALAAACSHALSGLPQEVGGILVGWREPSRIVVRDVLIVEDPIPRRFEYVRKCGPADVSLQKYLSETADARLGYVGEWHSHPAPVGLSETDAHALRTLARQARHPIALIVVIADREGLGFEPQGWIGQRSARLTARTRRVPVVTGQMEESHDN